MNFYFYCKKASFYMHRILRLRKKNLISERFDRQQDAEKRDTSWIKNDHDGDDRNTGKNGKTGKWYDW